MTESTTTVAQTTQTILPYWPTKICSESYFKRVVAAADTAYFLNGKKKLPDVKQIVTVMGKNPNIPKVASILSTTEFKNAMKARGIEWSGKTLGITPEQSYALRIMTDPSTANMQFANRLKRAGVTYLQWANWMKQPLFRTAFQNLTESLIDDNVGTAHAALVGKVASGDMRAIELYYKLSGRFDPDREANMNMQAILISILEILTRRITDQNLLELISTDMAAIGAGSVPEIIISDAEIVNEVKAPVGEPSTESVFSFNS